MWGGFGIRGLVSQEVWEAGTFIHTYKLRGVFGRLGLERRDVVWNDQFSLVTWTPPTVKKMLQTHLSGKYSYNGQFLGLKSGWKPCFFGCFLVNPSGNNWFFMIDPTFTLKPWFCFCLVRICRDPRVLLETTLEPSFFCFFLLMVGFKENGAAKIHYRLGLPPHPGCQSPTGLLHL